MKRLLVFVCAAAAVLLALRHPAPAPAIVASGSPAATSQHSRKGHPLPRTSGETIVYVVGAVAHPGLYHVPAGARINDAVVRAGGLLADADSAAVNLAQHVSDGDEIRVLRVGESAPAPKRNRSKRAAASRTAAALAQAPIDVNSADEHALSAIPGIGPTLAARIVEYRRLNGPFASLDELADVAGMTQRRIDAMGAYVTVGRLP